MHNAHEKKKTQLNNLSTKNFQVYQFQKESFLHCN
jgi:hypothetical protein